MSGLTLCGRCSFERLEGCGDGRGYPACEEPRVSASEALAQDRQERCLLSGDPGFLEVANEVKKLHREKARDYGTDEDAFANYVQTSEAVGEVDEFTCWLRIHEKCVRALNLIRDGRADENLEGLDVAALAIGAEALRRRRS